MQIVIVDNIDIRNRLTSKREMEWIEVNDNVSAYQLAVRVSDVVGNSKKALVLIHLKFRSNLYQSSMNAGAEVLEFLRFSQRLEGKENTCKEVHCVVYSAMPLEKVLREQSNPSILYSPGTTYHHLTSDQIDLDWDSLAAKRFDPTLWISELRKSAHFETDNHSVANWWGVHRLARAHSAVTSSDYQADELDSHLRDLNNLKVVALHTRPESVGATELTKEQLKKIKNLRERIAGRKVKILHVDDEWNNGWSKIIADIIFGKSKLIEKEGISDYFSAEIGTLRTLTKFPQFDPDEKDNFVDELFEHVSRNIDTFEPNCILLDLRLAGNRENASQIEQMSGVQLMRLLRSSYKGLPVVMTTASNKAWSIEKLMQQGVDAYWIKERPDINATFNDSVINYTRLLELIEKTSGEKYRFLEQFAKCVKEHFEETNLWYKRPYWSTGSNQDLSDRQIEVIRQVLNETLSLLRSYLHSSVMRYEYRSERDDKHLIANMITYSFHAIELIHNPQNIDIETSRLMPQNDMLANRLRQIRNDYAHLRFLFANPKNIGTFDGLRRFLIGLLAYLNISPQNCRETLTKDQILQSRHYRDTISRFSKLNGRSE